MHVAPLPKEGGGRDFTFQFHTITKTMLPLVAASIFANLQTPLRDQALVADLSKRSVMYFWEQSDPTTGLTRDRAPIAKNDPAPRNATIASIAATGYALAAYPIGVDYGYLDKAKAKDRTIKTLNFVLNNLQGNKGWYFHFVDVKTGKREWNSELSSIDSGLLFAGIHMAEGYWQDPEITKISRQIMNRVDWRWFLTNDGKLPNSLTFSMGWSPENGFIESRWDGFYEHMFLYILALGNSTDMETEIWTGFRRSRFTYEGYELINGAALFIHQMSQAYLPMKGKRDILGYDYWVEGRNMTLANRTYVMKNPNKFVGYGSSIWGMSACDLPDGYGAPGAPNFNGKPDDNGTLAPAAAVASIMYTPDLSIAAANAFVTQFPKSYGQYGFTTGLNPTKKWQSPDTIGIDIGQMMLAIEVYRTEKPHKWMMQNRAVKTGMDRAGFHTTEEGPLEKRPLRVPPK
ncbi:MAG: glucoamylase family protein [Fimbriimonadaceae bacterium]